MHATNDPVFDIIFEAVVIEWSGPAPFYFVAIPIEQLGEVSYAAREASYGWGCVPVVASIADASFATSLFPKNGGYLLPLKAAVRDQLGIVPGDAIRVRMRVASAVVGRSAKRGGHGTDQPRERETKVAKPIRCRG